MLTKYLHKFVTEPVTKPSDYRTTFWFVLSLVFTAIYCWQAVHQAFVSEYVIHDDVRSHVFWMRRYLDPELFPNDLIADYFQSVAPHGYATLYRLMVELGIDPVLFNKLVPIGLVFITAIYCFGTSLQILAVPAAGFIATLFLNQNIWTTHDVASGTPRAFLYPLFLAFLYYLLKRSLLPCLVAIALQGLFYPQCLFISSGILIVRLFRLENWRIRLSTQRSDYLFCITGLGVTALMLLPYALKVSEFGPVTSAAEGRKLPILQSTGRKEFFYDSPWKFWFCGERCGVLPYDWCKYFPPPQAWVSLSLPFLLRSKQRFPLAKQVSEHIAILPQILLSSVGMFALAHLLLFRLHLPSRYTKHSIRILIALAAGVTLILVLDSVLRACERRTRGKSGKGQLWAIGFLVFLVAVLFCYPPLLRKFPNPNYVIVGPPELYQFFAQQPKDTLIASLSEQANNIPTISRRSTLASSEIANPYHFGYFQKIRERTFDLMKAHYSQDLKAAKELIEKYEVDLLLIEATAFTPDYITLSPWLREVQPLATEAVTDLKQNNIPALAKLLPSCSIFQIQAQFVLSADCVLQAAETEEQ